MKVELTPCYILHRRDYRETSLILEVLSKEHGRVSLVAKGAKRNKKQQGVSYSPYQKYLMSWVSKTELGTLIDVELASVMNPLNPQQMMLGFYVNEIVLRLLHKHESHPELFDAYDSTIFALSKDNSEQILLRYFEKIILQSLGYGVIFDQDINTGEAIRAEGNYYYKLDFGPSSDIQDNGLGVTVTGKTLIKILLRSLLKQYLGDKPLASRQLYHAYVKSKQAV